MVSSQEESSTPDWKDDSVPKVKLSGYEMNVLWDRHLQCNVLSLIYILGTVKHLHQQIPHIQVPTLLLDPSKMSGFSIEPEECLSSDLRSKVECGSAALHCQPLMP